GRGGLSYWWRHDQTDPRLHPPHDCDRRGIEACGPLRRTMPMKHYNRLYRIPTVDLDTLQQASDRLRCTVLLTGRDDNSIGVLVTMDAADCEEGVNNFAEFEEALTLRSVEWRIAQGFGH